MTPIQKAIEKIERTKKNIVRNRGGDIFCDACDDCIKNLERLLPYEKEWAEKVWEGGATYQHERLDNMDFGSEIKSPDFNTFYSQYNQNDPSVTT